MITIAFTHPNPEGTDSEFQIIATFATAIEDIPGSQLLDGINADGSPRITPLTRPVVTSLQRMRIDARNMAPFRITPSLYAEIEARAFREVRDAFGLERKTSTDASHDE